MKNNLLVSSLLSQYPYVDHYPAKHKKDKPKPLSYFFVSEQFFKIKDKDTGIVNTKRVAFTYRKS